MPKKRVSRKQRQIVAERAYGCCEYCRSQARFATKSFSIEHIHPRKLGGTNELSNLAFACPGCNGHKHTKTKGVDPATFKLVSLYHPREQKWEDHFGWNEDFTTIVGLTAIGRATIKALQLNRRGVVNLRKVLYILGEHPPTEKSDDFDFIG